MSFKNNFFKIIFLMAIIIFIILGSVLARPKVGVVLSGGGARGIAHVGVLQKLEELKIPIDYIGGTSFGALIAAFYSTGYTPCQIEKIIEEFNWEDAFSNNKKRLQYYYYERKKGSANLIKVRFKDWELKFPNALSSSQVVINELLKYFTRANYVSKNNFLNFETPLFISATDIVKGRNKIFKEGDLVKILQASLSVPVLFPPVEMDSNLYMDGGVTNNLPITAIKKMGADYIIASNTTHYLFERESLDSALKIADQLINIMMYSNIEEELKNANVIIRPQVDHINNTQFSRWRELIDKGKMFSQEVLDSLCMLKLPKKEISNNDVLLGSDDIVIQNNAILDSDQFRKEFFKEEKKIILDSLKYKILQKYIKAGYSLTEIVTEYNSTGQVNILINAGIVNDVEIQGNKLTKDFVIKREIRTKKGSLFNLHRIISDVKRIYSTNYFETVSYSIKRINNNLVNVIFEVEEKPYGFIHAGMNYNTEESSSAFLSIGDDNVLGYANSIDFYTFFGDVRKFGFEFIDDRIFNTNLNFSIKGFFQDDLDIKNDREWNFKAYTGIFDDRRLGIVSTIFDYKVSNLEGQGRTVGLGIRSVFDSFNDYLYPTSGLFREVAFTDFNKKIGSKYNFQNFYLKNNLYFSPAKNLTFSLNLLLNLNNTKNDSIPIIRQTKIKPSNTFFGYHNEDIQGEDIFYFSPQLRLKLKDFSINDPRKALFCFFKTGIGQFGKIDAIDKIWQVCEDRSNFGYSIGLEISTIAGPVILSYQKSNYDNFWYFSIGYNF